MREPRGLATSGDVAVADEGDEGTPPPPPLLPLLDRGARQLRRRGSSSTTNVWKRPPTAPRRPETRFKGGDAIIMLKAWVAFALVALVLGVVNAIDCSSFDNDRAGCKGCVASGECVLDEETGKCETVADSPNCGDIGITRAEWTLIRADAYCDAEWINLPGPQPLTLQACADACEATLGCAFFSHAKNGKYGKSTPDGRDHCNHYKVASAECPPTPGTAYNGGFYESESPNDFYALGKVPTFLPTPVPSLPPSLGPAEWTLIRADAYCNAQTELLWWEDVWYKPQALTVQVCADACKMKGGCAFFELLENGKYGKHTPDGGSYCQQVHAASAECPPSPGFNGGMLVSDTRPFDFYALGKVPTFLPTPVPSLPPSLGPAEWTLIRANAECNGYETFLGEFPTLQACADACKAKGGCAYFEYTNSAAASFGHENECYYECVPNSPQKSPPPTPPTSPRRPAVSRRNTPSAECPAGFYSQGYSVGFDFYALGRVPTFFPTLAPSKYPTANMNPTSPFPTSTPTFFPSYLIPPKKPKKGKKGKKGNKKKQGAKKGKKKPKNGKKPKKGKKNKNKKGKKNKKASIE